MAVKREAELGPPVAAFLTANGYTVRSEVNGCDITAIKEDQLVIVELKRSFGIELLLQAVERQRLADTVYVAVPVEAVGGAGGRRGGKRRQIEQLLKRLELGLLLVRTGEREAVEVALHPMAEARPRRKPQKRRAILKEIAERSGDYNTGGATGVPILTAYREQAIQLAALLQREAPQSPAQLRRRGGCEKTQAILSRNVYGWFERIGRGEYTLRVGVWEYIAGVWPGIAMRYQCDREIQPIHPD